MANLATRYEDAVVEGYTKAEAADFRKSADSLRKSFAALESRLVKNEEVVLEAIRRIAARLDALEKAATPPAPPGPFSPEVVPNWPAALRASR